MSERLRLYSYWRSSAAYRVRIGLNLKGLPYEIVPVHLVRDGGEQHTDEYRAANPQGMVPVLQDEALVLLVRQAGSAETTPVQYLSGSQKFRVAISIALAIGQFSSGQDRPLESVIIDEGFGSLDKDGLRATADELNKLKGLLKRIILVSHQEEFTENFPVMYQLSKSDTGTVATKVRR